MPKFEKFIDVRWADCDANRHVRHSAYYDFGAHARIKFFSENGFDEQRLSALEMGPVLFKEECNFLRELKPNAIVRVNFLKGEVSEDASRWTLHHEIFNDKNEKCAHISIVGAWMNLALRKLMVPPLEMVELLESLPQGEAFEYKKGS